MTSAAIPPQDPFLPLAALPDRENYLPAIVVMTDGRSEGDPQAFLDTLTPQEHAVPIFGITFGDADRWYSHRREPRSGRMATLLWRV